MKSAHRAAALLLALALGVVTLAAPSSAQGESELGRITGRVFAPGHDRPYNVEVLVARFDPETAGGLVAHASTWSRFDGTFDVELPPGAYVLIFTDHSGMFESVRYPEGDLIWVEGGEVVAVEVALSPALRATTAPTVSGTPRRGETLVVDTGVWEPDATLTVQWYAGRTIPGATATTMRLVGRTFKAAAGKRISVRVTATAPDHDPVSVLVRVPGKVRARA